MIRNTPRNDIHPFPPRALAGKEWDVVNWGSEESISAQAWAGYSRNEPLGTLWEANGPGKQEEGKEDLKGLPIL